ncbi:MAG: tetratricopeptide repeat protein [Candidatus Obscuribacterales bacterium]|nr:tetratricopeptide repeat protein [Candidatus Obscuribacterales bacterium]
MPLKNLLSLSISLLLSLTAVNAQVSEEARNRALDLYNNSVALIKNGDFTAAETVLAQAWRILPDDPNILCNYGLALMKMGKLQEAKARLIRGTQVKPDYDLMWLNLGLVQEGLGDLVAAKASLQKFVALAPHNPYSDRIKAHIPEIDKLLASGVNPESLNKPDYIDELSNDQKQRWSANRMPLKIYLKPGDGVPGYKPGYGQALEAALQDWIRALDGKMSIEKVDNQNKADIVVKWTNDLKEGVNRSEGGDVRYSATAAGIDHADVTLLTLDPSPTVKLNDSLVYWISLHELGHGLGIVGHSRNPGDIMYFSAPQKVDPQLSSRDIQTIRRLYSEQLENWMTLNDQGIKLMHEQKFDEAIAKLEKALRLKPDKAVIKTNIITTEGNHALKLMNENKLDDVERHFARALDLEQELRDGNLPMLLNNYSVFLSRTARADEINDLYQHFGMKPPKGLMASGNAPWQKPHYTPLPTGSDQATPDASAPDSTGGLENPSGVAGEGGTPAGGESASTAQPTDNTTGGDNSQTANPSNTQLKPPVKPKLVPAVAKSKSPVKKPVTGAKPALTKKPLADKATTDKATTDKPTTGKAATGKAATGKAATGKATTGKATTGKATTGKVTTATPQATPVTPKPADTPGTKKTIPAKKPAIPAKPAPKKK